MTDHQRFLVLAATSLDFPLSSSEQHELERHLAGCPPCRAQLADMREDARALASFGSMDAPDRVRQAVSARARVGRGRSNRGLALLLAASFLVVGLVTQATSVGGFLRQLLPSGAPEASFQAFPEITEPPSSPASSPSAPQSATASSTSATASPTSGTAPVTTSSPSQSASVSATASGGRPAVGGTFATRLGWTATAVGAADGGSSAVNDVIASASGFVAVGTASGGGAAWTSPDGATWSLHQVPGAASLLRAAAGPGGLVAIAGDAVWRSPDGESWSRAFNGPASGAELVDVAYGAGTFVAVGRAMPGRSTATVWTSSDGEAWTRLPDDPTLASFCPQALAAGAFAVVLVGDDCADQPHAVVLSTMDLRRWTRQTGTRPFDRTRSLVAVTASDRRFVTGGRVDVDAGPGQAFFHSDDAVTWVKHGTFRPPGATESIAAVARFGSGYIGVGLRNPTVTDLPTTWTSPDGLSWARGDLLPIPSIADRSQRVVTAVAASGNRVVIVGSATNAQGDSHGISWTADLPT